MDFVFWFLGLFCQLFPPCSCVYAKLSKLALALHFTDCMCKVSIFSPNSHQQSKIQISQED